MEELGRKLVLNTEEIMTNDPPIGLIGMLLNIAMLVIGMWWRSGVALECWFFTYPLAVLLAILAIRRKFHDQNNDSRR